MPTMHAFYIKNLRTGKFHAGASYGGMWCPERAQFWTRHGDAEARKKNLLYDQKRQIFDPDNLPDDDLKICEIDIELE